MLKPLTGILAQDIPRKSTVVCSSNSCSNHMQVAEKSGHEWAVNIGFKCISIVLSIVQVKGIWQNMCREPTVIMRNLNSFIVRIKSHSKFTLIRCIDFSSFRTAPPFVGELFHCNTIIVAHYNFLRYLCSHCCLPFFQNLILSHILLRNQTSSQQSLPTIFRPISKWNIPIIALLLIQLYQYMLSSTFFPSAFSHFDSLKE